MLIGILKLGPMAETLQASHGEYADMFERLLAGHGFTFRRYDVDEKLEIPASPTECDGWLLTGSKHGVYEDHPFIAPLEAFIRQAIAAGQPVAGICFGHQIIAQAMGGHVEKFTGGWAIGTQSYRIDGHDMTLNAWHQDQVTRMPEGFDAVGGNAFCKYGAMVMGDQVFTIQPHPEFGNALIGDMIETRGRGTVPDELLAHAKATRDTPKDSALIGDRIARLFLNAKTRTPS